MSTKVKGRGGELGERFATKYETNRGALEDPELHNLLFPISHTTDVGKCEVLWFWFWFWTVSVHMRQARVPTCITSITPGDTTVIKIARAYIYIYIYRASTATYSSWWGEIAESCPQSVNKAT